MRLARSMAIALTFLCATPAHADERDASRLIEEGDAAFLRKDFLTAFARYESASAREDSARVWVRIARALSGTGKLVEARIAARRAEWAPASSDDRDAAMRLEAQAIQESLAPRIATIAIDVPATGTVALDGERLVFNETSKRVVVNPGPHEVVFQREAGAREVRSVLAKDGEAITVDFAPAPLVPTTVEKTSPLVYVGILSGAVGLMLGVPTGIATIESAQSCPDGGCDEATYDQALATGWVSTIGFGVAIGGAALTVVGLFTPRVVDSRVTPSIAIEQGGATLRIGGAF
jgi:hypothetical protein